MGGAHGVISKDAVSAFVSGLFYCRISVFDALSDDLACRVSENVDAVGAISQMTEF